MLERPIRYPHSTLATIKAKAPELYEYLLYMATEYDPIVPDSAWHTTSVADASGASSLFLAFGCAEYCHQNAEWKWVVHQRDSAQLAMRQLQERRILMSMQQGNVTRIHDDLDRAFQRTLSELRRQQNWRRDRATLTISPEQPPAKP